MHDLSFSGHRITPSQPLPWDTRSERGNCWRHLCSIALAPSLTHPSSLLLFFPLWTRSHRPGTNKSDSKRRSLFTYRLFSFFFLVAVGEQNGRNLPRLPHGILRFTRSRTPVLARFFANGASKAPPVSLSGSRSSRRESFSLLPRYLAFRQAFPLLAPAAKPSSGAFFAVAGLFIRSPPSGARALRMADGSAAGLLCVTLSPAICSPPAGL